MQSNVKNYKVELANKKYINRINSKDKLDNIGNYWKQVNNIEIIEPFQDKMSESTVISRENVTDKTGDGSITPKTHIHETSAYLDESHSTFVTEYAYPNTTYDGLQSHVVRFGINAIHDTEEDKNTSQSQVESVASSNFSKIKKYKLDKDNIQFKEQEKTVLKKAIEYLQQYKHTNSAIVDIFERQFQAKNNKSNIEGVDVNVSETHSIVILRSNKANKFIVVDPTTTTFSWILGAKNLIEGIELIVPQKLCTIYKAPNKTKVGKDVDQWRDCIDIAVKLSFLFNARSVVYEAPDNLKNFTIADWDEVKLVSNQRKIDKNCFYSKSEKPLRKKQQSDINKIEVTNNKIKISAEKYNQFLKNELEKKITEFKEEFLTKAQTNSVEALGKDYIASFEYQFDFSYMEENT